MAIFNISQPLTLVLLLVATILLIFLGKEIKKPFPAAIALAFYIVKLLSSRFSFDIHIVLRIFMDWWYVC